MKRTRAGRSTPRPVTPQRDANTRDGSRAAGSFPIVGIGASAGGLEAFSVLLKNLSLDTGMGFVLVQHLDPVHESALTQLLGRATTLPVHEVTNNLRVEPNHVYVIPPNRNLSIAAGVLKLAPRPRTRAPHRSIDCFFEALANDQRDRAIGVILSGTATDGTVGLESIKAEGGITFAQDDSARYDSMPRSAVAAGSVDLVLSPEDIATELARIAKHPAVIGASAASSTQGEADHASATAHEEDETPLPSGGRGTPPTGAETARAEADRGAQDATDTRTEEGFKKILLLLRRHSSVDFSLYKSSTIQRRIVRRLVLTKHETMEPYAQFLKGNDKELGALYSDVLISVTSFFRNPDAFDGSGGRSGRRCFSSAVTSRCASGLSAVPPARRRIRSPCRSLRRRTRRRGCASCRCLPRISTTHCWTRPDMVSTRRASPRISRPNGCVGSLSRRKAGIESGRRSAR